MRTDGEFHSRFYFYTVAIFPNPNPTRNPGLVAFQTWNPGLAKRLRVWNPYSAFWRRHWMSN